ncbi:AAA family ATPase [Thermosphaera chiliense]|uniref:AAA family ATPase n=1 Tax=Thermosphaera chiliense TaxID=3402707 RepID=A0A7M1UR66_9CREN|nr:ATP-binding protein [Thermosphaera aggregans]QOR94671.1 AAA family ATPase [Thermosphaera aggregans]
MLKVIPKSITVKNFKCLRDEHIPLTSVNIVVGPNSSGKTSLIEALYLFKLVLNHVQNRVPNPFLYWWSYRDAVWNHDEKLNIELGMEFSTTWKPEKNEWEALKEDWGGEILELSKVNYRITFSGRGGFKILEEKLSIPTMNLELVCREGNCTFSYEDVKCGIDLHKHGYRYVLEFIHDSFRLHSYEDREDWKTIIEDVISVLEDHILLLNLIPEELFESKLNKSPPVTEIATALVSLYILLDRMVILSPEASFRAREPARVTRVVIPSPFGEDLAPFLLTRYGGRVPEAVRSSISYILDSPDIDVRVVPTTDGRVFLEVVEGGTRFNPPSISNGLLKVLIIELALDIGSPIIVVDEFENSLHIKAIHRLLDDVRNSDSVFIATTHSPAVIDLVKPGEIIVMEKKGFEAHHKRFEDPEALAKRLKELGVTLGEYLAYIAP